MSGPTSPPPGGPSFATLVVHAGIREADADLAAALGWEVGVSGAAVSLLRLGTGEWETRTTDAGGEARYEGLLPGDYRVYVGRQLEADEAADAGLAVRAFGDGETLGVTTGTVRHDFELAADVTGSLVISEVSQYSPPPWETGGQYSEAHFVEVYNNGGATVFLDGKVLGSTFWTGESVFGNCALTEEARLDPLGIYSAQMLAFPGGGNEHPVAPGETRVVALSAIDHTPVHPSLFDLSSSAFEMVGAAGADNPAVPNMIDIGLDPYITSVSGGSSITPLQPRRAVFLAEPVDPHSLPILFRDVQGKGHVRVPAERLIDVTGLGLIWAEREREFPPCHPMLDPAFDRYEGGFLPIALGVETARVSYQRRILRVDGHPILQDTNTSAVDFMLKGPSPGVLPN